MRRVSLWLLATTVALVLLFSYHTSTSGPAGAHDAPGIAPVGVVTESPVPTSVAAPTSPAAAPPNPSPTAAASPTRTRAVAPAASPTRTAPTSKPSPTPAPKKSASTTKTVNGAPADTRYGPVQVQIRVSGGRIVSSDAIVYPTRERRDREINDYAVPQLNDEAVQAQSANIDTVSGATFTSEGYRESLQSAIDAAHL